MKNRGNIVFIFAILTLMFLINYRTYSITSLQTCFDQSGADFIKSEVEGYAIIDTDDSPEIAAHKVLNRFDEKALDSGSWDNQIYTIKLRYKDMNLIIKSKEVLLKKKVYVSATVSQYKDNVNINNIWSAVAEAFSVYTVQPSYSSLISGKYNSKLTENEMIMKVKNIFSLNHIKSVDKMADQNIISVCGYMPGNTDYIIDNKKKVNINIALRYSETFSCTYISIGSPVIAVEY